jgi:hypothetical protein
MKIVITVILLCLLIINCKKLSINTEAVRFINSKVLDSSGQVTYYSFEYNSSGSVIKVFESMNNNPGVLIADIEYSGNDIVIKPVRVTTAAVETDKEIRYTTNVSGQPVKRIEFDYQEFKAPANIPQKDFKMDTAVFAYDSSGLLVRVSGGYRDSTWFNGTPVQTYNISGKYETRYTNAQGNVQQVRRIANEKSRVIHSSQVFLSERSIEENLAFEYTQSYRNKTDFTNAVLLREFNILFDHEYPLSEVYAEVPGRIIVSKITRDETGKILNTENSDTRITIGYNLNGLISILLFNPGLEMKKEIIYGN